MVYVSTITRRMAILASLGLPTAIGAMGAAAKEFWDEKFPEDWTPEDIKHILSNSPWVQPAVVRFDGGPGGADGFARSGYISPADRVRYEGSSAEKSPGTFHGLVRWESAKPLCAAQKRTLDGTSQFFILALTGDFPDEARPRDGEDPSAAVERLEILRSSTKLERKGDSPIYLDHMEAISGGEMFYFSRLEGITLANKEITFSTKMGPLEFKAKFPLKDMLYRGKLEL
jgi:hypothetical protein